MHLHSILLAAAALGLTAAALAAGADRPAAGPSPCQLAGLPVPTFGEPRLSAGRFQALHAAMTPRGESERWTEIPWQSDLQAARQKAAREEKPLLIWVMDGHPLGCT
jgi:hypothetical protein